MKILKYISIAISIAALAISLNACIDEDINKNPNELVLDDLTPDYLFGLAPIETAKLFGGSINWWNFGNYTQQMSMIAGAQPAYGRGNEDKLWEDLYTKCLKPVVQLEVAFGKDANYTNRVAIAKIWKFYLLSQAVCVWGDVPASEAAKGKETTAYDNELDIYNQILNGLNTAANELKDNGDKYAEKTDPVFNSDISKWRKFAHSLRLRVAMRVSEYEEPYGKGLAEMAKQIIKEELTRNEILNSNEDNVFITFRSRSNERNPYYDQVDNNTAILADVTPMAHTTFIMWLKPYNDPRMSKFYEKSQVLYTKTDYIGRPSTYTRPKGMTYYSKNPYESFEDKHLSQLSKEFTGIEAKYHFMTYSEICCIRAEAALKGYWNGQTPEICYYDAIKSFGKRYTDPPIADDVLQKYMDQPGIKWSTPVDTTKRRLEYSDYNEIPDSYLGGAEDNLKRIVLQHWIALYYQGIDSWTLLRRRPELKLPPHWHASTNAGIIPSTEYNHSYIPQRLVYPLNQITLNPQNLKKAVANLRGKQDEMTTRLRWAKCPLTFEGPQYPYGGYPNYSLVPCDAK